MHGGDFAELAPVGRSEDRLRQEYGVFPKLTEQFVLQQLSCLPHDFIGYWTNEKSTTEVDFLFQTVGRVIPIEVKAGESLQSRSFKVFCRKYEPGTAIRTSLSDYREESWITNLPLYAIDTIGMLDRQS